MDIDRTRSAVATLIRVRNIFEESLHPGCTLIAIDLLLAAARSSPVDRRDRSQAGPTVKELFAQVGHSSRGIRVHFNRLVDAGVLVVEPGRADRRTKTVRLSSRGEQMFRRIAQILHHPSERESHHGFRSVALRRHPIPDGALERRRPDR